MAAAWGTQRGWARCGKCQGLWFGPNQADSTCPRGGRHDRGDGANYSLVHQASPVPPHHDGDFRWCHKCQGLWLAPSGSASRCPAGDAHDAAGSGSYAVANGAGTGPKGWHACEHCQGLWFATADRPERAMSICPGTGPHVAAPGEFDVPQVVKRMRIHTKVLTEPTLPLTSMLQSVREVYALCGVDIDWASDETLDLPDLTVIEAAGCKSADLTDEQRTLFEHRNFAADDDIVVYVVQQSIPVYNGCAAHPDTRPGLILTGGASAWTLGHEIGHLLGLRHTDRPDRDRLMTSGGTKNITSSPPSLLDTEVTTLMTSALLAGA